MRPRCRCASDSVRDEPPKHRKSARFARQSVHCKGRAITGSRHCAVQRSSALPDLTDAELHALIAASNGVPPVAYGLLVWIEGACDWELNRRAGHDYELLPPEAAIDPLRAERFAIPSSTCALASHVLLMFDEESKRGICE